MKHTRSSSTAEANKLVAMHRFRLADWTPTAIVACAASGDATVLAVARDSGALELWNTDHWHCFQVCCPGRTRIWTLE